MREAPIRRVRALWLHNTLSKSYSCPACLSKDIRFSHRRNTIERLLSVLRCRPFRCNNCQQRFWAYRELYIRLNTRSASK